jgi:hypothetical protein
MARTWWLRADLTAVGGARLMGTVGVAATGEDGRARRRGREWLTGRTGQRQARWAAAGCGRE